MREVKNLKGEVVKVEPEYGEKWWHLSGSTWFLIAGLLLLNIGFFVKIDLLLSILRLLDIRIWPWEVLVLVPVLAGFLLWCVHLCRNWEDYDDDERRHHRNFIGFGITVTVVLLFLLILSMSGRFFLFFRPVTNLFSRGMVSMAAVWRSALIVVPLVPLIYFGKEWICGFWDE